MAANEMPPSYQPLRTDYAYVVQLGGPAQNAMLSGRVEHVASGQALRFSSADELLRFLTQSHSLDDARRGVLEDHPFYRTLAR